MASISAPVPFALSYDPEEADDQDVDQLASSDDEMDQDDDSPLPTPRNPGESYLPSERLETIIQADGKFLPTCNFDCNKLNTPRYNWTNPFDQRGTFPPFYSYSRPTFLSYLI
jgi:hypothetical protein